MIQLNRLRVERDRAFNEVDKWRARYGTEAKQRRAEAEQAEKTILDLRAEVSQLCQLGPAVRTVALPDSGDSALGRLQIQLARVQRERDELAVALEQEQQQHAKTRENLITALGDVLQRGK